jgi:hypothetical protein
MFDDEIGLIGTAIVNYGFVCPFEDAQKEVIVALSKGQLQEHQDRSSGVEFFEREEVLRLWPDPRWETLRAKTEPLTLAEAVTGRAYGQELSSALLRERRRRHGGVFPAYVRKKLDMAGERILEMIRRGEIQAEGFPCVRDEGTGRMNRNGDMARLEDDHAFLAHRLWVDPCADAIWTQPQLADGSFNPIDRGYRDICLSRAQFLEAVRSHQTTTVSTLRALGGTSGAGDRTDAKMPRARITPAPRRGRAPQYDWQLFHDELSRLIRSNPGVSKTDATRAMRSWCGDAWNGEDRPGEPAFSTVHEQVTNHPGAPWVPIKTAGHVRNTSRKRRRLTDRQRSVIEEMHRESLSADKQYFSTPEFNDLCVRCGVINQTTPSSSKRRIRSALKAQLAKRGLITVAGDTIRLASLT